MFYETHMGAMTFLWPSDTLLKFVDDVSPMKTVWMSPSKWLTRKSNWLYVEPPPPREDKKFAVDPLQVGLSLFISDPGELARAYIAAKIDELSEYQGGLEKNTLERSVMTNLNFRNPLKMVPEEYMEGSPRQLKELFKGFLKGKPSPVRGRSPTRKPQSATSSRTSSVGFTSKTKVVPLAVFPCDVKSISIMRVALMLGYQVEKVGTSIHIYDDPNKLPCVKVEVPKGVKSANPPYILPSGIQSKKKPTEPNSRK